MTRPERALAGLLWLLALAQPTTVAQVPPPRIAIVYGGGESTGPFEVRRAVADQAVDLTVFAPGRTGASLQSDTRLDQYDLVLVDGTTTGIAAHRAQINAARAATRVVVLSPSDDVSGNVDLTQHASIARYWAEPSQDNYAGLVRYLVRDVLGRGGPPAPAPIVYPTAGFYHPQAPRLFASLAEYDQWAHSALAPPDEGAHTVTVGVTVQLTSYLQKNLAHVDAVIAEIERRGHRALTLATRGAPDMTRLLRDDRPAVDVVVQVGSVFAQRDRPGALARTARLDVPILSAMHHHGLDEAGYAASPTGLLPTLGSAVVEAEQEGRIEPMAISGRGAERGDSHFSTPYTQSVAWRVARAIGWARLRTTPNKDKRVYVTYWSQGGGKANVGGDPDDFLDVPATLVRLLADLRARGYDVGDAPLPDRDALTRRMALEGSNVGSWAPGELAERVARGVVRLVPEREYLEWFATLPEPRRREIVEMWGPPPGRVGIHTDARGQRHLVVPGLAFGNVYLAPNPDWGYLQDSRALMSTGALPPHHQYVAFFLWMQKTWRAHAWVDLFSNISLQGGKPVGPLPDDHIGLLLGDIPHVHPERLGASGGLKPKRKALAQTVSWYSLVRPSGTDTQHFGLRALLQRFATIDDPTLRTEAERLLRAEVHASGLGRIVDDVEAMEIDALAETMQRELERLDRTLVPAGSKVLGTAATGDVLVDMVTAMLGPSLTDRLAGSEHDRRSTARRLVRAVVVDGTTPAAALAEAAPSSADLEPVLREALTHAANLAAAPREVEALVEALDGRWIPPGSLDDPIRRPNALPPGRSVYNFDSAEVPTVEAEALGVRQADALIAAHRTRHDGAYPRSLAFAIFSGEIARNRGVTEAQILHLLGTRAVRDTRGVVTGVELIAREALGRPRIDVMLTTSGTYRDHYPDVMALIAKASALAAASPEDDNPVRDAVRAVETQLSRDGMAADRAAALARARVFAPAPGAYSPSIQFLAKSGDQRGDERKMAELYTSRLSHAYGEGLYGEAARPTFERQLDRVQAATFARGGIVNGMLDHPMSAGFLGGLNLAAKVRTGRNMDLYVSNIRDERRPTIETAAAEIQRELRTRYLNRSWVSEMQSHGYEGARTFMYATDHLDLWDSTASHTVTSDDWQEIKQVYVDDSMQLGMDRFFDRYNPHAQQVLLGNLAGAATRGHWDATDADRRQVLSQLARSVAAHGVACEANLCRNPALTAMVTEALAGSPEGESLARAYAGAIARATTAPAGAAPALTSTAAPGGRAPGVGASGRATGAAPSRSAPRSAPSAAAGTVPPVPVAPQVTGRVMETVAQAAATSSSHSPADGIGWIATALAGVCVAAGWWLPTSSYRRRDAE